MENIIEVKLKELRNLMAKRSIDMYIITKSDPHQSEVAKEYWNSVKYISGFSGSAGMVAVTINDAILWTDGRYSIQSREEVKGSSFKVYITSEPTTIDYLTFIEKNMPKNGVLAFDGRTLNINEANKIIEKTRKNNIRIESSLDLIGEIWKDRNSDIGNKIFNHKLEFAGISRKEKISNVRNKMREEECDIYILSSLDDIAWSFNLRGNDNVTLCFESFAIITMDECLLFADKNKISDVKAELEKDSIIIKDYSEINSVLSKYLKQDKTIVLSPNKTSYALYNIIKDEKIKNIEYDITSELKVIKNQTEIENIKEISLNDGAAVFKFILWIKEAIKSKEITEYEAGLKMDDLRSKIDTFLRPSFSTICGYGENGAITHYKAKEEGSKIIKEDGFLLLDSGGNYLKGTTDITRTFALGKISDEMKKAFTLVLKGHIALARAKFLFGATGSNLDILARLPLWENNLDYKHGTGHGIGFALNCHEGPHRINLTNNNYILDAGMLVSNEPGFYKDKEYGIRSENIVLVRESENSNYGRFMEFETISYCPFDLNSLDLNLLNQDEKLWLNNYHKLVFEKLSPLLTTEEINLLKEETREI